ncbi:hypothetical protein GCM10010168_75890 [Actinoplanes ianthinogenes]|uniref:Uncharacterized protein n=1 Tax=Actinoplanes ianthinogenes TaxID=122358 RepID=A0ABM7M9Y4_9ACTN|nr:hypothetical protein [Actinoplanes ianthinogenes]BCJ48485.1 hypothetical protein Aiant_91420 [Actinoplanes ianthinogenes]GGR46013.1 hypothetical protein GCM10010168_75890 [Actinoplanes ianthinogenes]
MTESTRSGRRLLRLGGWALGAVAALAVLGVLLFAGGVVWLFAVALPAHARKTAEVERDMARTRGIEAQAALTRAAADGSLTDDEIHDAVGGPVWDVRRMPDRWTVRTELDGGEAPVCFSYDITRPFGPGTSVTATELPTCPPITPD